MVGSYLDSPLYRQMLAQTMQGGPASQYPGQAIANGLAQALQAYSLKKFGDKQEAKLDAGNAELAKTLLPEQFRDAGGGQAYNAQLSGGGSIAGNLPNIQDGNADGRAQLVALLKGGVIDGSSLAPMALQKLGLGGTQGPIKLGKDEGLYDPNTYEPIIKPRQAPMSLGKDARLINPEDGSEMVGMAPPEVNYNQPFLPDGTPNKAFQQYEVGKAVAGRPSTNIALNTEKTFAGNVASGLAGQFTANREKAQAASAGIQALQEAKQLLNSGIFTGQLAELQLLGAKMGMGDTSKIGNTEAFQAAMGRQTLALVKNLGAGAGISNADREYADKVAGGKITLNKESLEKIIDINERAQRGVIQAYNKEAAQVAKSPAMQGFPTDLTVPEPAAPPAAQPSAGGVPRVLKFNPATGRLEE